MITLREGDENDIDILMRLMESAFDPAFGEAWNSGQCLGMLSLPDVWLTFAQDGARPIGFALSRLLVDDAELLLLAVEPGKRRHGVGRALVERAAEIAGEKGVHRLLLEMRDGNEALDLYRSAGFREIGRRSAYYRGADGATRDALTLARGIAALPAGALSSAAQSR